MIFVFDIFLILLNHIPLLVGVFIYNTNVSDILILYWLESLLINIFCFYKMKKLKIYCLSSGKIPHEDTVEDAFSTESGHRRPVLKYLDKKSTKIPDESGFNAFIQRLLFPNKVFFVAHTFILAFVIFLGFRYSPGIQNISFMGGSFLMISIRHFFDYNRFLSNKELIAGISFKQLQTVPTIRLAGLHITIIAGIALMAYGVHNSFFIVTLVLWEFFCDIGALLIRRRNSTKKLVVQ